MSPPQEAALAGATDNYQVRVIGAPRPPLRDFYHALLRLSWTRTLLSIAATYFVLNLLFGCAYWATGGVAHARPGLRDAFYFSAQTLGTIGYGAMYPQSDAANLLVVIESLFGLVFAALITGIVFSKFARPTARLLFSRKVALSPMNGVPTLSFRLGNLRPNRIVEAQIRVALVRTERTSEGKTFYRMLDLKLVRERALSLTRAWTVLHTIDAESPLHGQTPESLAESETELLVTVSGIDDTWMQNIHASYRYSDSDLIWGGRLADVLKDEKTLVTLDLTKFHDIEASEPSEEFPYPRITAS